MVNFRTYYTVALPFAATCCSIFLCCSLQLSLLWACCLIFHADISFSCSGMVYCQQNIWNLLLQSIAFNIYSVTREIKNKALHILGVKCSGALAYLFKNASFGSSV